MTTLNLTEAQARLPELVHSLAPGEEVIIRLICSDQVEIKVGEGVSRSPGIGAAEKSGHHPLICEACGNKAVQDKLVVLRRLSLLCIHGVVSPVSPCEASLCLQLPLFYHT